MIGRGRRWAVAALAAVFLVGLLAGVALEEALDDVEWPAAFGGEEDDDIDEDAEEILADLDLTPRQRERIDAILERREDRLEAYWSDRLPEIRAIVDSSYAEIRSVLTPEQRAVFDRWLEGRRVRIDDEARD